MMNPRAVTMTLALAGLSGGISFAAQHQMPQGMTHEQHMAQMKERGNAAMGFDQDKTTHHFLLTAEGGTIQVQVNDSSDTTSRDQIRSHLKMISEEFAKGDFHAPLITHNETPPGVPAMRRLKSKIKYEFEEKPAGGEVHISSSDGTAVKAIHEFLTYQIKEHETGDPVTVTK